MTMSGVIQIVLKISLQLFLNKYCCNKDWNFTVDIKTIDDQSFSGKRVIVRVDFNVPIKDGIICDDTRIKSAIPTIMKLSHDGAKVILMSHLGRPSGNGYEEEFSLQSVADRLSQLIDMPVVFAHDIVGDDAQNASATLHDGEIMLLENLRFDSREKKNDEVFASDLASLADVFVNDAFGCAHRTHASTAGIANYLPSYAGYLMQKEVDTFSDMLQNPKHPFVAILGGSKVSDKIKVIDNLIDKVDCLIIGGAMCFTFLRALGNDVGTSLVEDDWCSACLDMLKKAEEKHVKFLLPVDVICANEVAPNQQCEFCDVSNIPHDMMGLDIGPKTIEIYKEAISNAKTIFWNGPLGVFEIEEFANGTKEIANALALNVQGETIIGGGDSVSAVNKFGLADKMTFISTGGGASMQLVEGEKLPGVEALKA